MLISLVLACAPRCQPAPHPQFPLEGEHADAACAACHVGPDRPPTACESCHARPDPHFAGPCAGCHTPAGWEAPFAHEPPLLGPHALSCESCHQDGTYE